MLRHSDLVTSPTPSPLLLSPSDGHGRVPIAVGATVRAGGDGGQEKIQPVKDRDGGSSIRNKKKLSACFAAGL